MKSLLLTALALSLAATGLTACVQQSNSSTPTPTAPAPVVAQSGAGSAEQDQRNVVRFSDLPMPPGAQLDTEKSIILGAGEDWTGRVLIQTPNSPESAFDFYRKELSGMGWREITAVRAAISVLTYVRDGRVATIQLQKSALGGTDVSVTVSPEGKSKTDG